MKNPKVEMQQLIVFILLLVVAGVAAMVGLNVQDSMGDSLATCSSGFTYSASSNVCVNSTNASQPTITPTNLEYNASVDTKTGISNLTAQFPNIGLVVAAVIIIGLLVAGFAFAFNGRGGF